MSYSLNNDRNLNDVYEIYDTRFHFSLCKIYIIKSKTRISDQLNFAHQLKKYVLYIATYDHLTYKTKR